MSSTSRADSFGGAVVVVRCSMFDVRFGGLFCVADVDALLYYCYLCCAGSCELGEVQA